MTEYDAFGNPVQSGSWTGSPTSMPETTPRPVDGGDGGGGRGPVAVFVSILVAIVVLVGIAVAVVSLVSSVSETTSSSGAGPASTTAAETSSRSTETAREPARPKRPPGPPRGLSRRSLLLRANFAPALREIRRRAGGGRPVFVRVEPTRIDVQVKRPRGGLRQIQRTWDARAKVISDSPGTASGTVSWAAIDPAAPRRLALAVRAGSERPSRQLAYAVMLAALGRWSAFRANGTGYTAALDGRNAQRMSG